MSPVRCCVSIYYPGSLTSASPSTTIQIFRYIRFRRKRCALLLPPTTVEMICYPRRLKWCCIRKKNVLIGRSLSAICRRISISPGQRVGNGNKEVCDKWAGYIVSSLLCCDGGVRERTSPHTLPGDGFALFYTNRIP